MTSQKLIKGLIILIVLFLAFCAIIIFCMFTYPPVQQMRILQLI